MILLFIAYFSILRKHIDKNAFATKQEQIYDKNAVPQFSIEKIYLCSGANAIDNTEEQKLDTLDLYQYTDIAVYINNYDEEGLNNTPTTFAIENTGEVNANYNLKGIISLKDSKT